MSSDTSTDRLPTVRSPASERAPSAPTTADPAAISAAVTKALLKSAASGAPHATAAAPHTTAAAPRATAAPAAQQAPRLRGTVLVQAGAAVEEGNARSTPAMVTEDAISDSVATRSPRPAELKTIGAAADGGDAATAAINVEHVGPPSKPDISVGAGRCAAATRIPANVSPAERRRRRSDLRAARRPCGAVYEPLLPLLPPRERSVCMRA